MDLKAVSVEDPGVLMQDLTSAIHGCGGWVLNRGASDAGAVTMSFEFARQDCVEIYGELIAVGVILGQSGHVLLTELCQCTLNQHMNCRTDLASINLVVQTYCEDTEERTWSSRGAKKRDAMRKFSE